MSKINQRLCVLILTSGLPACAHLEAEPHGPPVASPGRDDPLPPTSPLWLVMVGVRGAGQMPDLPAGSFGASAGTGDDGPIAGTYKLCVDLVQHRLLEVSPAPGIPGAADPIVMAALRGWTWRIDSSQALTGGMACWEHTLLFSSTQGTPIKATFGGVRTPYRVVDEPPYLIPASGPHPEDDTIEAARVVQDGRTAIVTLTPELRILQDRSSRPQPAPFRADKLRGDLPHLPNSLKALCRGKTITSTYKICISPDGSVTRVAPVMPVLGANRVIKDKLGTWVFSPLPMAVCIIRAFKFVID